MLELGQHIITVANRNNLPVTNIHLQKIMYFTMQTALQDKLLDKKTLVEMYDTPFYVWRYGATCEEMFNKYRIYGADSIIKTYDNDDSSLAVLDSEIVKLLNTNPFVLVDRSIKEPFWIEHEGDINGWRSNIPYTLANIKGNNLLYSEYKARIKAWKLPKYAGYKTRGKLNKELPEYIYDGISFPHRRDGRYAIDTSDGVVSAEAGDYIIQFGWHMLVMPKNEFTGLRKEWVNE